MKKEGRREIEERYHIYCESWKIVTRNVVGGK